MILCVYMCIPVVDETTLKAQPDDKSLGAVVSSLSQSSRWAQLVALAAERRLDLRASNAAAQAVARAAAWQQALSLSLGG